MRDDYEERLLAKLEPRRVQATLSFAGLVLIVYEMAKTAVIDQVRGFYATGFDGSGSTYDEVGYRRDVRSLDRSLYRASARWLVNNGAITEEQVQVLERLHEHRKDVAHELAKYLVDPEHEPDAQLFADAVLVLRDIHRFWTQIEIDIGTFEEHGHVSVDDIEPLSLMALRTFIDAYIEGLDQPAPG